MACSAENVLAFVERVYDVEVQDAAWVSGITAASRPLLDAGHGVHGFRLDLATSTLEDPTLAGGSGRWTSEWRRVWWDGLMRRLPSDALRTMVEFGPVSYTIDLWSAAAASVPTFETFLVNGGARAIRGAGATVAGLPYPDSLNVVGLDASGVGLALCANRATVSVRPPDARTRSLLGRLAGHMSAASRLRARLGGARLLDHADALLTPGGGLVHAEPLAASRVTRAALRSAARDIASARSRAPRGGDAVLTLWRALHAGGFSLVDTFDTDGRRFLVAKANAPTPVALTGGLGISPRGAQVLGLLAAGCSNKLIAYELDIAPSTVASHVKALGRKLGARSLADLVRRARATRATG